MTYRIVIILLIVELISGCMNNAKDTYSVNANFELAKNSPPIICASHICDVPPKLIYMVPPGYPTEELKANVIGMAIVTFDIDEAGNVFNIRISQATTSNFGYAAREAVERWKYDPAKLDKVEVVVTDVTQRVEFRIK